MIYTECKVSIKNDKATIDSPIILFRGDREVEIMFTIVDSKFKFGSNKGNVIDKTQASFGQLAVALPDGTDLFTEIVECENGVVIFSITGEMIDEIHEVGFYSFHIRLYNDDKTSRITLPPVMEGIEIREPLIIEGDVENTDLVGDATVGYSMVQTVGADEEVFDEEGNYIPTVWGVGDTITAEKLNKIEEGISVNNKNLKDISLPIENNEEEISDFELGAFSQGNPINSNQRIRNINFINVNKGDILKFANSSELYKYTVIAYDSNKSYIGKEYGWLTTDEFVIEYDGYIKCMISYSDNREITDVTTASTGILSIRHLSNEELIKDVKADINYIKNGGDSHRWFIPKDLYIVQNRNGKRRLRIENMINAHNLDDFYLSNGLEHIYNHDDKYIIIDDVDSTVRNQQVIINRKTFDTLLTKHVISLKCIGTSAIENPSSNRNILIIGDSFIDRGYLPCEIKNILINDLGLTNLNFVGTKSDSDGDVTCLNEGNGGITLSDYIKTDNTQGRGTEWTNPFLFDGAISYQTYMVNNSFGNLDICVIMCGVNDILAYSSSETELVERLKQMIDQIHSEYPECKIFIVGQKYASDETDYIDCFKWNEKIIKMNSSYQDFCYNSAYEDFCFYVDCGLLFDRLYGSIYEKTPIYKGSDELKIKVTDWLHPNEMGFYQIAENIAGAIAYNCFKIE